MASKNYPMLPTDLGVIQPMGAVGLSADNALAESFNATLKREVLQEAAGWVDEKSLPLPAASLARPP